VTVRKLKWSRLVLPSVLASLGLALSYFAFSWLGFLFLGPILVDECFLMAGFLHRLRDEGFRHLRRDAWRNMERESISYMHEMCFAGYYASLPT